MATYGGVAVRRTARGVHSEAIRRDHRRLRLVQSSCNVSAELVRAKDHVEGNQRRLGEVEAMSANIGQGNRILFATKTSKDGQQASFIPAGAQTLAA